MTLMLLVAILIVIYMTLKCIYIWRNDRQVPPGPTGIPVLGYAPFLKSTRLHEEAEKLSAKYGEIISMRIAGTLIVFLNSSRAIRQALLTQGDAFTKRPEIETEKLLHKEILGIMLTNGRVWSEHRRFALKVFKGFGVGKNIMEGIISDEVNFIKDVFQDNIGRPFNPRITLGKAVANVICRLVFNERAAYEDAEFERYLKAGSENLHEASIVFQLMLLPYFLKVPVLRTWIKNNYWEILNSNLLENYTNSKVLKHVEVFQENSDPKDYIDAFLQEKHRLDFRDGVKSHSFHTRQLNKTVNELFLAGTDTTSATLSWSLLLMAIHKKTVQAKVFNEIQAAVGTRAVTMADKKNLPYTEATINEVLRFRSIAPLTMPRDLSEKTQLLGYTIPPGALVFANIYAVHKDEKLWRFPYRFEPQNFLQTDANGCLVIVGTENLISFSIGKRSCLGEGLARMELFLFFARLLQQFEFTLSCKQSTKLDDILNGSTGGAIWAPNDYFVEINSR